jgi:hypothetical protein
VFFPHFLSLLLSHLSLKFFSSPLFSLVSLSLSCCLKQLATPPLPPTPSLLFRLGCPIDFLPLSLMVRYWYYLGRRAESRRLYITTNIPVLLYYYDVRYRSFYEERFWGVLTLYPNPWI